MAEVGIEPRPLAPESETLPLGHRAILIKGVVLINLLLKINVVGHIIPLSKWPVSRNSFDIKFGTLGQYVNEI